MTPTRIGESVMMVLSVDGRVRWTSGPLTDGFWVTSVTVVVVTSLGFPSRTVTVTLVGVVW